MEHYLYDLFSKTNKQSCESLKKMIDSPQVRNKQFLPLTTQLSYKRSSDLMLNLCCLAEMWTSFI